MSTPAKPPSTLARRRQLPRENASADSNPGLLLYRWLEFHEEGTKTATPALLNTLKHSGANEVYKNALGRWKKTVQALDARTFSATTAGPLAVGLGNTSPLENGLTLQHTYGMPVIPGSAVKGLVLRAARAAPTMDTNALDALGGTTEAVGCVDFFDAWFDHEGQGKPFHIDVVTVHHPQYYTTKGKTPPTDFDDPIPNQFLIVRPGVRFFFAFKAPNDAWADFVEEALKWALAELGAGAKTNSGYGRFDVGAKTPRPGAAARAAQQPDSWQNVTVSYIPNTQELQARQSDKKAGCKLADLRASLDEAVVARIQGTKGGIVADIDVTLVGGKNYKIVALRPK